MVREHALYSLSPLTGMEVWFMVWNATKWVCCDEYFMCACKEWLFCCCSVLLYKCQLGQVVGRIGQVFCILIDFCLLFYYLLRDKYWTLTVITSVVCVFSRFTVFQGFRLDLDTCSIVMSSWRIDLLALWNVSLYLW